MIAGVHSPITNDNTDSHTKVTNVNSTSATAKQAVADKNTSRSGAVLAGRDARALAKEEGTGANRANGEGKQSLCSLCFLLLNSERGDAADFTFLARDTASPYIDNRPLLTADKPELREYKCVYVLNDEEIGLFSDKVALTCAP